MRKIIHNLRRQPEEVRRHILYLLTGVFGVVLFSFWVYSLGVRVNDEDTQANMEKDLETFSTLKGSIIDGYYSISDSSEE